MNRFGKAGEERELRTRVSHGIMCSITFARYSVCKIKVNKNDPINQFLFILNTKKNKAPVTIKKPISRSQ